MKIRALTYNVWGLPDLLFHSLAPHRRERIAQICGELRKNSVSSHPWDFVFIQEAWLTEDRELFKRAGFPYVLDLDETDAELDSGLLILSRHPLRSEQAKRFVFEKRGSPLQIFIDGEVLARKSIILTPVDLQGVGKIWIANLHLVATFPGKKDLYHTVRRSQLQEGLRWFKNHVGNEPYLLCGDFNFQRGSELWNELHEHLPNAEFEKFPDAYPEGHKKLDHLVASSHLRTHSGRILFEKPQILGDKTLHLSDHLAWEATYQLSRK